MTRFKTALFCGAAATLAMAAPANAAQIVLVDLGGVTGSQAEMGFKIAANYWASLFTNNVTIRLGVSFAPLDPGVIGSTGSRQVDYTVKNWETRVNATKSNSAIDQNIVLPTLNAQGGATFIADGLDENGNDTVATQELILGDTVSSKVLYLNSSVIKAIGGNPGGNATTRDGNVTFSSNFAFDFNPTDGITAGTFDFIGVAIHEIGHALGFVSGVDFIDYYGQPNGPGRDLLPIGYSLNDTSIYSALDMFRYSNDPTNLVRGPNAVLDLSVGGTKFFSIDGGKTALLGNTFSTGDFQGDGRQASHWKDTAGCQVGNGIMDPTFCFGQMGVVTGLDLAAFDAIGWNLSTAATANYRRSTSDIFFAAVPEPATWAMMIAGFGMVGASMRRRKPKVTVSYAS